MNNCKTLINRKLYRQISSFIVPKPCGFSTPRTRMPAGIRQGLRPLRTLVHVCQCAGIRVHAIDWRDSRRGHALQRRDSGRHHLRLIFVSLSDRSHGLLKSPQSTQRAQSCATPVTTFEKPAASRFRTQMTRIARIFMDLCDNKLSKSINKNNTQ